MPQVSMDFLGLLTFSGTFMNDRLNRLYGGTSKPIAFLDESLELQGETRFYILASGIVEPQDLWSTRQALLDCYGGEVLHAAPMHARREIASLTQAVDVVSKQHDGADIVVLTEIHKDDIHGHNARKACIDFLIPKLQIDFDTELFVFDHLSTPNDDKTDTFIFSDLRKAGRIQRDSAIVHAYPSEEALLGIPDCIAWTYRQDFTGNRTDWFGPLRDQTIVTTLEL